MMLATLLYKLSLFLFGFNLFLFTRCAFHTISVRNILRHLPGPGISSVLFGEEWELYRTTPGSRYVEWHREFGKVVRFNGAFGVGSAPSPLHLLISTSIKSCLSQIPKPLLSSSEKVPTHSQNLAECVPGSRLSWVKASFGWKVCSLLACQSFGCVNGTLKERKNTSFKGAFYPRHSSKIWFKGTEIY